MYLGIFKAFEIYSNPPYRIVVITIITQIVSESKGHTLFIVLFFISIFLHTHAYHTPYT